MPFSNEQYREIRHHLEGLLREAGLNSVLDEAEGQWRETAFPDQSLRTATIGYFTNVVIALHRRSRRTYERAVGIGREFIRTESGEPISGFSLVATPIDREFLGFDEISLSEAPDLDVLEQEIRQVIMVLESD